MFHNKPYVEFDQNGNPYGRNCSKCSLFKTFNNFNKVKTGYLGFESTCKQCKSIAYFKRKEKLNIKTKNRLPRVKKTGDIITHRSCNACFELKKLDQFHKVFGRYLGVSSICNLCRRDRRLINKYGITPKEKNHLYEKQEKKCLGCSKEQKISNLYIDHDHQTKKIRGLLCNNCNAALGLIGDGGSGTIKILENFSIYCQQSLTGSNLNCSTQKFEKTKRPKRITVNDCMFDNKNNLIEKRCSGCLKQKPITDFGKHKSGFFGYRSKCKQCEHQTYIEKKYQIKYSLKKELYKKQNNKCKTCEKLFKINDLYIDHDHKIKNKYSIRGLLCNNCNTALGFLGDGNNKSSFKTFKNLILYISSSNSH